MDLTELSMQVARVDERTQTMREEMHNSFHRVEAALRDHVEEDRIAHMRIAHLEQTLAHSKGVWKFLVGVGTAVAGLAGMAYYIFGIINHGG